MNAFPATHGPLLGEIVTWDLHALEIPYATVTAALKSAGLPESAASDLRATTAFGRAVKDLREGRAIDRVTRDKTTGIVSFQFTRKALRASGLRLDFDYEAVCHLNTDTGQIDCPDSREIEDHARRMFAHAVSHRTTSDITRLVQRLFQSHADLFPINPRKGVAYFVPQAHANFTASVQDFLAAVGGELLRFPVPCGTPEGNRAVKTSVESGLAELARELNEAVDAWTERTRPSTMQRAVEQWQQIKHKAEAYSEYLGDRQAELLATLDANKRRLAARIQELQPGHDVDYPREETPPLFPGAEEPVDVDAPETVNA